MAIHFRAVKNSLRGPRLKVHKNENFFGSDFKFVLFYSRFCKNIFFDWAIIGEDTIFLLSLRLSRIKFSQVSD